MKNLLKLKKSCIIYTIRVYFLSDFSSQRQLQLATLFTKIDMISYIISQRQL